MASGQGNGKKSSDQFFSKRPSTKPPRYYGAQDDKAAAKKTPGKKTPDKKAPDKKAPDNIATGKATTGKATAGKATTGKNTPVPNTFKAPAKGEPAIKRQKIPASANKPLFGPNAPAAAGGIACVVVVVCALLFFTNKNAYQVYVSGNLEGTIAKSKDVTEEYIYNTAVAKLQREVGSNVSVDDEVTFVPVHAGKSDLATPEYIIGNIYKKWPYQVEASVLSLNGTEMAVLASDSEVDGVLERLASQYIDPSATLAGKPVCEGVAVAKRYVDPGDIISADAAYAMLNATTEKTSTYQVQSGDNLGKIAAAAGLSLDELLAVNPGLDVNSRINIGQPITLVSDQPIVAITTVEEVKRTEPIPKAVEKKENPSQHTSYSQVISQGEDGEREVTEHVTRINGTVIKAEQVDENVLKQPTPEVVEVGTNAVITAR